jgi:16S rRNA pseudouridine516 synthase
MQGYFWKEVFMRLDKLLSNLKYGSRKEVKQMIKAKRVHVNKAVVTSESLAIDPVHDEILLDEIPVFYDPSLVLMMHKPKGFECSHHPLHHQSVFELLEEKYKRLDLEPVGRLDQDTTGLLLMTNDGVLLHDIISPKNHVYKRYLVTVDKPLLNPVILTGDYTLLDNRKRPYQPKNVNIERISDQTFYVDIHEGKYHQIKAMFAHFGYHVDALKRLQIGSLELDDSLDVGDVRVITKEERSKLFN